MIKYNVEEMRKCDWWLLGMAAATVATAVALLTGRYGQWMVWEHVVVACAFFALAGRHIWLHFGWRNWLKRIRRCDSMTRLMWWTGWLGLLTGLGVLGHWLVTGRSCPAAMLHGRIAGMMIVCAVFHLIRRARFLFFRK